MTRNPPDPISTDSEAVVAFDRLLDWAIGGLLGFVGLLATLGGVALFYAADRSEVSELIRNSEFHSDVLTEAQAIDALVALGEWSGIGLVVAGGLTLLIGVAVVIAHRRARHGGRGTPRWILGVVGATVGLILGFVPFSPVLGGAVAGYLDPDRRASGVGSGTMAGVFAALPLFVVTMFAGVGLFAGLPSGVAAIVVAVIAILVLLSLAYLIGLSALGGYLGGLVR